MTIGIGNFYLGTRMEKPEFMLLPYNIMPSAIRTQYRLDTFNTEGKLYVQIDGGMYGLSQAEKLAHDQLLLFWGGMDTYHVSTPKACEHIHGDQ